MTVTVKICGLTRIQDMLAATSAGASFIGIVFAHLSPRFVFPRQAGEMLRLLSGTTVSKVGLFVNPDDTWLVEVAGQTKLDMIQLHGQESVERVASVRKMLDLPVIKAIAVHSNIDFELVTQYSRVADWLLFDSNPPTEAHCPGGNGVSFDWHLLERERSRLTLPSPWMLAGGLTPANVSDAVRLTGTSTVDVSSGVEEQPGIKSLEKIHAFFKALRQESTCIT